MKVFIERLEDLTVAKARAGIEKMVQLTPQTARVIYNQGESIIPAKDVKIGDRIRVLPGEMIPVDGVIVLGQTSINQAVMTGESIPVDKTIGDEVRSGAVNQFGTFEMNAVKVGTDSSIQRMIQLVQSADAGKAKIVSMADRWATWIVVIALSAAALTWLITGEVIRSVTILVVFCPCSLVLATPTAIMAAIGNAAKHGFLVREGDALERLASVGKIAFDKTGTLTIGEPKVTTIYCMDKALTDIELYRRVAIVEKLSEHPLGKAISKSYEEEHGPADEEVIDFRLIPGQGVSAKLYHQSIYIGNEKLLLEHHIIIPERIKEEVKHYLNQGSTSIYIGIQNEFKGYLILTDTLRSESKEMLQKLKGLKVSTVLLTGDHEYSAQQVASHLEISEVCYEFLPEDKMQYIDRAQVENSRLCMIGDGINDAPALKKAFVGIAMGGIGSDIAIDAADIVLVNDEVKEIPHLFSLARKMMKTIKINLVFSMVLNFLAIILAITGTLSPVIGALVHNAGSILVIINSAILLKWRRKADVI